MGWKEERYFSGMPMNTDPSKPLPGELSKKRKRAFYVGGASVVLVCVGALLGLALAPDSPKDLLQKMEALETELEAKQQALTELGRKMQYDKVVLRDGPGALSWADRQQHMDQGRAYARLLKGKGGGAQAAAELIEWFVGEWNDLLDFPQPKDRIGRRARLLSFLVSSMAKNLNPGDFAVWQGEFFRDHHWLGELHRDLDSDGFPGFRKDPNPKDAFAGASICTIAMALNQTAKDALILLTPSMRCDAQTARVSMFLHGSTVNDAFDTFVSSAKEAGFFVKDAIRNQTRLIWLGPKPNNH